MCVPGHISGGQIEQITCCDALSSLFSNIYLRCDLKIAFCYVMMRNMVLSHQNQRGRLTTSDVTLALF